MGKFHSIVKIEGLKNQKCKRAALILKTESNTTKIKLSKNVYLLSESSPTLYYFDRSFFNFFLMTKSIEIIGYCWKTMITKAIM